MRIGHVHSSGGTLARRVFRPRLFYAHGGDRPLLAHTRCRLSHNCSARVYCLPLFGLVVAAGEFSPRLPETSEQPGDGLHKHGFNPRNMEAREMAKKVDNLEQMMDELDVKRKEIYLKLEKLRRSSKTFRSDMNRKLLFAMTDGRMTKREKLHVANFVFNTLKGKSDEKTVKGSEFIVNLVNTGKFSWSEAQETLGWMYESGLVYEIRNDLFKKVNSADSPIIG